LPAPLYVPPHWRSQSIGAADIIAGCIYTPQRRESSRFRFNLKNAKFRCPQFWRFGRDQLVAAITNRQDYDIGWYDEIRSWDQDSHPGRYALFGLMRWLGSHPLHFDLADVTLRIKDANTRFIYGPAAATIRWAERVNPSATQLQAVDEIVTTLPPSNT